MPLTPTQLSKLTAPGMYGDGGGLYLQIQGGSKSWVFRYSHMEDGKRRQRYMGLGPFPDVTLAMARTRAAECRELLRQGIDPLAKRDGERQAAKEAQAKAMSFREAARLYIEAHAAGWRNPKHSKQWNSTLAAYAYPILGELGVNAIDTGLVMKVLEPIWNDKPETASRVRGRIEAVLGWASARGYRDPDKINPAQWVGHLDKLLPAKGKVRPVKHHAALPYAELPAFMARLREQQGVAARALEFLILTAARTSEVTGAQWSEISDNLWTIPADRMKRRREHRVPLCHKCYEVIGTLDRSSGDVLFPGIHRARLSSGSMERVLDRMSVAVTVHGFRSTFRTWAAERTNYPREIIEAALAHQVGDKVEAAYMRSDYFDKRRRLMEAWATFCGGQSVSDSVVPLRRA